MTIPHFWHNIDSEVALRVPLGQQVAVLTAIDGVCDHSYHYKSELIAWEPVFFSGYLPRNFRLL